MSYQILVIMYTERCEQKQINSEVLYFDSKSIAINAYENLIKQAGLDNPMKIESTLIKEVIKLW